MGVPAHTLPASPTLRVTSWWANVPRYVVIGLAIRFLLIPFHHPWDLQTFYNMFVDLATGRSPYDTFHDLMYFERSSFFVGAHEEFYRQVFPTPFLEYYAYPPLPIFLYYLPAKLCQLLAPLHYRFVDHPMALQGYPLPFLILFKLPLFISDVLIAWVLYRVAGEGAARSFFLNPLVIFISAAWMIDSPMALFTLVALLLATQRRYAWAGACLALGTLTKWSPAIFLPTIGLWMIHSRATARDHLAFYGVFGLTLLAGILPFREGVALVATFQALRPGGGMTPYLLFQLQTGPSPWLLRFVSPVLGAITLPLALGVAYRFQLSRSLPLPAAACLTYVAFLLGSKIVHEAYVFTLLPLLLWEQSERPSESKVFLFKAAYALPLAFAMLGVPLLLFLGPAYLTLFGEHAELFRTFDIRRAWPGLWQFYILVALALAFVALLIYAYRILAKEAALEHLSPAAH